MGDKGKIAKVLLIGAALAALPSVVDKTVFTAAQHSKFRRSREVTYNSYLGEVNYTVFGTGEPVVLIHDTFKGGGLWEWDRNLMELGKVYRVYALDLPGFGLSEKPWTVYTAYCYTRLIMDFLRDVVGESANVIASGHSASDVIHAAALEPALFKRIVAISPYGISGEMKPPSRIRRVLYSSSVIGTSLYTAAVSKKQLREFLEKKLFYSKELVNKATVNTCWFYAHAICERGKHPYAAQMADYLYTDIKKSYAALKMPVLVVWGEENVDNPLSNMDILERMCPENQFAVFEYTRMLPHYENSVNFNLLVHEFFETEDFVDETELEDI
ncbi:MAG: alpha/beta hydrolase [Firmicutes bacterium]|nr:alpha/beta hydrolase [Bacillota bacterium]